MRLNGETVYARMPRWACHEFRYRLPPYVVLLIRECHHLPSAHNACPALLGRAVPLSHEPPYRPPQPDGRVAWMRGAACRLSPSSVPRPTAQPLPSAPARASQHRCLFSPSHTEPAPAPEGEVGGRGAQAGACVRWRWCACGSGVSRHLTPMPDAATTTHAARAATVLRKRPCRRRMCYHYSAGVGAICPARVVFILRGLAPNLSVKSAATRRNTFFLLPRPQRTVTVS